MLFNYLKNLILNNLIFWGILFFISYLFSKILIFKYKSIFIGLFAITALYSIVLNQYVMSEEFF